MTPHDCCFNAEQEKVLFSHSLFLLELQDASFTFLLSRKESW